MALSLEEKATNADTSEHIRKVCYYIHMVAKELLDRADAHDQTKLASPEVEAFTEFTGKLAGSTYGSQEYEDYRKAMEASTRPSLRKIRIIPSIINLAFPGHDRCVIARCFVIKARDLASQ